MIYEFKCTKCGLGLETDTDKFKHCSQCNGEMEMVQLFGFVNDPESKDATIKPSDNTPKAKTKKIKKQKKEQTNSSYARIAVRKIITGIDNDKAIFA